MTDRVNKVRRSLVAAMCAGPFVSPGMLFANEPRTNLYYSRSGRFTAYGGDDVFVGGLLVEPSVAAEIETSLTKESEAAGFFLDLTVGTNRHLPDLLELSLDVLSGYHTEVFIAAMLTDGGEVEPDILTSVRTQYEAEILLSGNDAGKFEGGFVDLIGVKHARKIDDAIYTRLLARDVFASVNLHESHSASSHLYRLSSALMKCLAASYYDRELTKSRERMRAVVLNRFEISEVQSVNARTKIVSVQKK
jgi:hypothetical protein